MVNSKASCGVMLREWASDSILFAKEFCKNPKTLGTPFVLSPFVATELLAQIKPAAQGEAPRHFLEVGPGTGAITKYLIRKLAPCDQLHVVEINEKLCQRLRERFGHIRNVHIHHAAIQDWVSPLNERKFDVIISAVPFQSLPSTDILNKILSTFQNLVKAGGFISLVEYTLTTGLGKLAYFGAKRKEFGQMIDTKNAFFNKFAFKRDIVWPNFPFPARVTHCQVPRRYH